MPRDFEVAVSLTNGNVLKIRERERLRMNLLKPGGKANRWQRTGTEKCTTVYRQKGRAKFERNR
jgi:hypothetical protein